MKGTARIVLYRSKTLKNGEHPIMLRLTRGKKQTYISLNVSCSNRLWDEKTNRPRKAHPQYKHLLELLDNREFEAKAQLRNIREEEITEKTNIAELFQNNPDRPLPNLPSPSALPNPETDSPTETLTAFYSRIIERLEIAGRVGYAGVFRDTRNKLLLFTGKDKIEFKDLTVRFLSEFEAWMQGQNWKKTTMSVYLRNLRAVIGYARKEKVVPKSFQPFAQEDGFSMKGYNQIDTPKRSIDKADVQKIADVPTRVGSVEFHAQQLFLFTYYCRGISFIDVAYLTRSNVVAMGDGTYRLRYQRHKTDGQFDMLLLEPARQIWERYLRLQPTRNRYVWPILHSEVHVKPKQQDWRITRINREWNKGLRKVAEKAGLGEYMTLYVARHTFAWNLKQSDVSTDVISQMLGHKSLDTTEIYLRQFPKDKLDKTAHVLVTRTEIE